MFLRQSGYKDQCVSTSLNFPTRGCRSTKWCIIEGFGSGSDGAKGSKGAFRLSHNGPG